MSLVDKIIAKNKDKANIDLLKTLVKDEDNYTQIMIAMQAIEMSVRHENFVQEDVTVTVTEKPKSIYKEVKFTLQTGAVGVTSYISDIITGEIDSLLIDSDKPTSVYITLADFGDIVLFDSYDKPVMGYHYLPIRTQTISSKWEGFTQSADKWILNNKIRCEVSGSFDATVNITIRYR
jgi:hypothetical protein